MNYLIVTAAREQTGHATRTVISETPSSSLATAREAIKSHWGAFVGDQRGRRLGNASTPGMEYHIIPACKTTTNGANEAAITAEDWETAVVVEFWDGTHRNPVKGKNIKPVLKKIPVHASA